MKLIIETTAKPLKKDGKEGIAFEFSAKSDNFDDATAEEVAAILAYLGDKSVDLLDTDNIKRVVETGKTARKDALDKLRFSLMRKLLREIIGDLADVVTKDAAKDAENGEDEQPAPKEDPKAPAEDDEPEEAPAADGEIKADGKPVVIVVNNK